MSANRAFKNFLRYFGQYIFKTSRLVFPVSVLTFEVYFLAEQFKTGLISNYFDLNFLLFIAIISGIIAILGDND